MKTSLLTSTRVPEAKTERAETDFLSGDEAANLLNLSPRTLERFRIEGRGPAYCKFGRLVRYHRSALIEWALQQQRSSTAEAA